MRRYVAIRLKVPDNTAYTALVALRRLGIDVGRVERAMVVPAGDGDDTAVLERIRQNEQLFNPNLHEVEVLHVSAPRSGEIWIREVPGGNDMRFPRQARDDKSAALTRDGAEVKTSWRLSDHDGKPVTRAVLERARDLLLCNPAIEQAELPTDDAGLPA